MAENKEDYDSDAPEEFTADQGVQQDEELRKAEKENKARVVKEGKERRRQWAQKKTPRKPQKKESIEDAEETEPNQDLQNIGGMLPEDIVNLLAAREKQVFTSDSEDEKPAKKTGAKKKRPKSSGFEPVILGDIAPSHCLQSSLEFLKKRKMMVSRSSSVLNNSNQALRLLSASGVLTKK